MKKEVLTVKKLASELRMSLKSIQRAYLKGRSPCNSSVRSHASSTSGGTEWTKPHASSQRQLDTAGRDRRRQLAARTTDQPPSATRGHYSQG